MKRFKILMAALLIVAAGCALGISQINAAGGGIFAARVSSSATTVSVGSSAVLTINTYYYECTSTTDPADKKYRPTAECPSGYINPIKVNQGYGAAVITASGSGNTLSASTVNTGPSGIAQVSLSSSVAEIKTVNVYEDFGTGQPSGSPIASTSVRFVTPAPVPAPAPAPAPQPAKPRPVAVTEVAPPTMSTTEVNIGGTLVKSGEKPSVKHTEPLVLTGKTVAGGVVNIYVFSEPKKYTVTADKDGNWSHSVSGLPPGDHHIEAEVTDPATGKTSPRAQVLAFRVVKSDAAPVNSSQPVEDLSSSVFNSTARLIGLTVIALAASAIIYMWKFRSNTFHRMLRKLHLGK